MVALDFTKNPLTIPPARISRDADIKTILTFLRAYGVARDENVLLLSPACSHDRLRVYSTVSIVSMQTRIRSAYTLRSHDIVSVSSRYAVCMVIISSQCLVGMQSA